MKVAAVQLSGLPGDLQGNLQRVDAMAREGARRGCRLLLFPELTDLGYDLQVAAEQGRSAWPEARERLAALATELDVCLVCGVCLPGEDGLFNALVAFGPAGDILCEYRKIHLLRTADTDERKAFVPGRKIVNFELDGIRFGLSLCYDLRFPELFRAQVLAGCQCLLLASAWPLARIGVWEPMCISRAAENQCFLLGANRTGDKGAFPFGGRSLFVTPTGEADILADMQEGLVCGEVNPEEVAALRRNMPVLSHRRPDIYAEALNNLPMSL
jgi:predicted amidohydrolase